MRYIPTCLIVLCLVCGCSGPKGFPNRAANVATQIGNEFDLSIIGFGTRQVGDGIIYSYGYNHLGILSEHDARELLVEVAQRLAADLQYEDTGEALGISRLDLVIFFRGEGGTRLFFPHLGMVKVDRQEVGFVYWASEEALEAHTRTYETWDEALAKVNEQGQSS